MTRKLSSEIIFEATPKQQVFIDALLSGKYLYMMYGGGIRGGKTYLELSILFILCRIFPRSRWAIVRKNLMVLRQNILPAFNKLRPEFVSSVNQQTWISKCKNGSEIILFPESFDIDKDLDRFKGLEVNGFLIDEANELQEKTFYKCIERAGSWVIPDGEQPPPLVLATTNPADYWGKRLFYEPYMSGNLEAPYYYLPALIVDNPYIPEGYIESLKNLPEKEYKRFVEGDWTVSEDPDQLISYLWVKEAIDRAMIETADDQRYLGVDVARFGDDKTTIAERFGMNLVNLEEYADLPINRTSDIVQNKITELPVNADNVRVDTVGLGAGVADNLNANGFHIHEIISGASPSKPSEDTLYTFKNLRAQMWWNLRELLKDGKISFQVATERLIADLTAVRYKISSDKSLQIESKDEIKKRTGRSTDDGDSVVYAFADIDSGDWGELVSSGERDES